MIADEDDVAVAAVTIAELRVGALLGAGRVAAERPPSSRTCSPPSR
ncbi:MAG: hypothetical protein WKF43_04190 [Acidimicrobiales bacterium]